MHFFAILTATAGLAAAIAIPNHNIDKRCSLWNLTFNPCICPSAADQCAGNKRTLPAVDEVLPIVDALPTASLPSLPTTLPTTLPSLARDLPVVDDLPAVEDLPVVEDLSTVEDLSNAKIDKRCSLWNLTFNPCICPSAAEQCAGNKKRAFFF